MSKSTETTDKITEAEYHQSGEEKERISTVKQKRKVVRARITRSMNRIRDSIQSNDDNHRRLNRELEEIKRDSFIARDLNSELYAYVSDVATCKLDQWEDELTSDIFDIEEELEDYLNRDALSSQRENEVAEIRNISPPPEQNTTQDQTSPAVEILTSDNQSPQADKVPESPLVIDHSPSWTSPSSEQSHPVSKEKVTSVDSWIDELVEFQETNLPRENQEFTIAEALFKLESSRDIPSIQINKFDGNPLHYVDFIECFQIQIHNKTHLNDNARMSQLKSHLTPTGDAARVLSGMGSQGTMYATALKTLKQECGQRSVIARAYINKITRGGKVNNDRESLRDFSLDIFSCIGALTKLNYTADINANETLRAIIKRLPDPLIDKWKSTVAELRDKGHNPTINHISDFIRKRLHAMFDPDFGDLGSKPFIKFDHRKPQAPYKSAHFTYRYFKTTCPMCKADHKVYDCLKFKDLSVDEKVIKARDNRLCFSCLNEGHTSRRCRNRKSCGINGCKRTHHHLFHTDPDSDQQEQTSFHTPMSSVLDKASLSPVVRARFRAANGRVRYGNVLVDSGAGTTIIRKEFAESLGLQGIYEALNLAVVGGEEIEQENSRRVNFWLSSLHSSEEYEIEAHELDKTVINVLPLNKAWLKSFRHLKDIEFTQEEGPVDLILGVGYSHLHAEEEIRQGREFEPLAKKTRLGWYVIGSDESKQISSVSISFVERVDLNKFYEFETLGIQAPDCHCQEKPISKDDKEALQLFESSCKKEDSRYVIALPWKQDPEFLPNNYPLAFKRLTSLEKGLSKTPTKAELYNKVIEEYESNGWSKRLTKEELEDKEKPSYFLPHHGVYRPEKISTPLRVVFDPACKYKGISLNSFLHKGPCLIGNLLGVLLRFREERIAFTGDIAKMFLQVCLDSQDTYVHRFLWRNLNSSIPPSVYRLMRVTFGDKPSPDMASFVILKIAKEIQDKSPEAAVILRRDRYMDDLIHSCSSPEDAWNRIQQLETALNTGSFKIKEWFCSSKEIRDKLSSSNRESPDGVTVSLDGEGETKTLGLGWNSHTDVLKFSVKSLETERYTKRIVLSKLSTLYDPMGLASVVTIRARIEMQNLWRSKQYDWDDPLPDDLSSVWNGLFKELQELQNVEFPRCIKPEGAVGLPVLNVFSDASSVAYGAVAYLLWNTPSGPTCSLISSKARVAPLRQNTIPRLELMAALVSSRLAKTIEEELKIKPRETILWSDSKIVLHWIRSESLTLKPFVGVRVSEIQSTWDPANFRHVPSGENPSDELSRGISVSQMTGRWMNGPEFLKRPRNEWPNEEIKEIPLSEDPEVRKKSFSLYAFTHTEPIVNPADFSNWQKLIRITAYCLRFINRVSKRDTCTDTYESIVLQPSELESAERHWIISAQNQVPDWKERYRDLTPFIEDRIVRVGGRLGRSQLPYDQVHPILLSPEQHISKLIVRDIHNKSGHLGTESTLCEVRRKYWVVRGRNLVKSIVRNCVVCRRFRQPQHSTLMADLPPERLKTFSPVFSVTGIDLFGPLTVKISRNKHSKVWGVLFTCATVRAIHLEIAESPSTESFLHTLRRFAALHGWPSTIITDNGSNFVGARKELQKLVRDGRKTLEEFAMLHKVKWLFITPLSPHQGGMYESLVKQTKKALRVSIGNQVLTWNELSTVFAEAKSLVNSRPLGYASNDPNDLQPLTPNHFILGRASTDIPQGPYEETKNLHRRFLFVQMLVHQFWKRFITEYIPTLIRRAKWQQQQRQMQVNDIVLLSDFNLPRGKWELARVIEVYPGKDNIVRNVMVKTKSNTYKRSVQRLCPILES